MNDPSQMFVFDRALVQRHRERAAAHFEQHQILFEETSDLLMERLGDIKRDFASVLDLGARNKLLADKLKQRYATHNITTNLSATRHENSPLLANGLDEELLPVTANCFDLVVSNLHLHWVNDVPGVLKQIKQSLKPDGLFLACLLGGDTLYELRECLMDAELKITGGISPRVSPRIDLPTASALLQRAGFALPVTDQETIVLTYSDMFALMRDLRGMGENNSTTQRLKHFTRRSVFMEAARLYTERYVQGDGRISATFEVIFLHGWK
jgi:SAM-dependent methyltransferase